MYGLKKSANLLQRLRAQTLFLHPSCVPFKYLGPKDSSLALLEKSQLLMRYSLLLARPEVASESWAMALDFARLLQLGLNVCTTEPYVLVLQRVATTALLLPYAIFSTKDSYLGGLRLFLPVRAARFVRRLGYVEHFTIGGNPRAGG